MAYVIGCLMAGLSFIVNKLLLRFIGIQVVISYSPVIEEITKTMCSYYLSADIVMTHFTFGILEAGYDWYSTSNKQQGFYAALLSVAGHSVFGGLTVLIFHMTGSILAAILGTSCVHLIWNVTLIRLS